MTYQRLFFIPFLFAQFLIVSAADTPEDMNGTPKEQGTPTFLQLKRSDLSMSFGGRLKDDFFFYNSVRTLRNDYGDQNNFVRHRLDLDFTAEQGKKRYGTPASEAAVRLTNYVYWQQYGHYLPFSRDDIRSTDLDSAIVARDVTIKTLIPLIFVEQAWFKLNLDTFMKLFEYHPASLKVGFFKYQVGRGISLGYHNDMAVDYLGWPGEGHFTRYPQMPPGVLFRIALNKNWSADLYWMKWTSVGSDLENTHEHTRAQRLDVGPGRGVNKDRSNYVLKFDYQPEKETHFGKLHLQPYLVYTDAPEQAIEFEADASSKLFTLGTMLDCTRGNWNVNVEVAGQFGHQNVYPIDRNTIILERSNANTKGGSLSEVFSHIYVNKATKAEDGNVPNCPIATKHTGDINSNQFHSADFLQFIINSPQNRAVSQQGKKIEGGQYNDGSGGKDIYNANSFGNARFRPGYRLDYQGFMALADVSYTFNEWPYKLTTAAGYISGDNYPYNDENNHTYYGFVPMRSRYTGQSMENFLIFDRLVLPRPLNISNRTLWAYNNLKDLSNLQFLGIGLTWYPLDDRKKCFCTTNLWCMWEVAHLKAWDKYGHNPDPSAESQIALERARLGFPGVSRTYTGAATPNTGWISSKEASRMLGVELDLRATYNFLDHANGYALLSFFLPGQLYRDLEGQPNYTTRSVDNQGLSHYDSLGSEPAFAAVVGLNYKF